MLIYYDESPEHVQHGTHQDVDGEASTTGRFRTGELLCVDGGGRVLTCDSRPEKCLMPLVILLVALVAYMFKSCHGQSRDHTVDVHLILSRDVCRIFCRGEGGGREFISLYYSSTQRLSSEQRA